MKMIHLQVPGSKAATLEGYILDCELLLGQEKKRPAVVVCPGGGYLYCSPREAEPVAMKLLPEGYNVFILDYSVKPNGYPAQLIEVAAAMELIYENSRQWDTDAGRIAIMGFSAGGHLAASLGVFWAEEWLRKLVNASSEYRVIPYNVPNFCQRLYVDFFNKSFFIYI